MPSFLFFSIFISNLYEEPLFTLINIIMSLFEWFGESYFPGEIGTVEKRSSWTRKTPRYKVIINFVVSIAMIAGLFYLIFEGSDEMSIQKFIIISVLFIVYCLASFVINPKPDYKNIGIGGTPIDHPFRISDDINRFLMIMKAMLWPGFYITRSFIELVVLIKHGKSQDLR